MANVKCQIANRKFWVVNFEVHSQKQSTL